MAYTALYRKFRPLTFREIVGQEHITQTLKNQITAGRIGHAYLFNGGRGTGKTSAAKVLARAINCLNPKDGEPCNECEICKGILAGSLTDVVEMDAASNNSVEDIRSIREEVNFLPTLAKYRVYIIDEVHMLSTGAFNALLKTLEEPPEHVKFILATTEPQKLPATILSRCQRFDFKRISDENIKKRLAEVCQKSNIQITPEALTTIAVLSEGAMRDSLSILERCIQDGEDTVSEDKVKDLVGIPKITYVNAMINAIVEYNVESTLQTINTVLAEGKDLNNLLWEMIKYTKDVLAAKTNTALTIYSQEEIQGIQELAKKVSKERLLKLIYSLSELENTIKWSSQKLIMFQAGIIKLCNQEENGDIEELRQEVKKLAEMLKNGTPIAMNTSKPNSSAQQPVGNAATAPRIATTHKPVDTKSAEFWPQIMSQLKANGKIMLYTNLLNTKAVELNDLVVAIEFPNGMTSFGKTVLEKPESIAELTKLISVACGKQMKIKYMDKTKEAIETKEDGIEDIAKDLDIPINIVEE